MRNSRRIVWGLPAFEGSGIRVSVRVFAPFVKYMIYYIIYISFCAATAGLIVVAAMFPIQLSPFRACQRISRQLSNASPSCKY